MELSKIATEQRNDKTMHIDQLPTLEMIKLINEEDKEYFIPYLDAKEAFGYEEAELEESFMMIMPDDLYS